MKKIIFFGFLIMFNFTFSQNKEISILGLWQQNDSIVSSMYYDTYQFHSNGTFVFKPNEYNGLNRILSINGTYKLKNDKLILTPLKTEELIGGYPVRSEITTLSDSWEIKGAQKVIRYIKKRKPQITNLKFIQNEKCILIDCIKYFKTY